MIRVEVNGVQVAIPADVLAREVMAALPEWLRGGPANTQQGVIRSGLKGILPMMLSLIHADVVKRQAPIPPPDVRNPAARGDIISYALNYLVTNLTTLANADIYVAQGDEADGVFVVTGFISRSADVAGAGESERAGIAASAPKSPTR